jgi:hypothetical protein
VPRACAELIPHLNKLAEWGQRQGDGKSNEVFLKKKLNREMLYHLITK